MTGLNFLKTSAIVALMATPAAASDSATDVVGNSPSVTEGGNMNVAASDRGYTYDTNSPQITDGRAEADDTMINMSRDKFMMLTNAKGDPVVLADGTTVGTVQSVGIDAEGNSEIVVALSDTTKIDADELVVTATPDNINFRDGSMYLMVTEDSLYNRTRSDLVRSGKGRTSVYLD